MTMNIKQKLFWLWRKYLIIAFIFFAYHLIRDILQDVLNIHNAFTEVFHYEPNSAMLPEYMQWLLFGGYRKWISFPMEIFALLTIPYALTKKKFIWIDFVLVAIFIFWDIVWLFAWYYATLE